MKVYKLTVTTEWLDEETGEIIKETRELKDDTIKKPRSSSSSSKSKIQENPNPILTLEDNKYILTTGAVELLGVEAGDKILESCRGKANEELSAFGTEFTLEEHPNKSGLFILRGENTPNVSPEATKKQPEPEDEDEIELDEDLENEEEEDTLEISDDDFNFDEF